MKKNITAREIVLGILVEINENGAYSNIALKKVLSKNEQLSSVDKSFITEMVNGTLKFQIRIDYIIGKFTKIPLQKISVRILNILRMGIYQILYMDKVPVSAACNESVNLAKKYGHSGTIGFTNGILRNVARNINNFDFPPKEDFLNYASVKYAFPIWIIKQWRKVYSPDFIEKLCEASNKAPEVTLRINELKSNKENIRNYLQDLGIKVEDGVFMNNALRVKGIKDLKNIELFQKGYFQVQDESSMLVGAISNPRDEDFVIDVCSAPGGKATDIASLMHNTGKVIARDIYEHKIQLIEETSNRLGLTNIEAQIFDAQKIDEKLKEKADIVLVDAPCSGLGIIRKKPDIKLKKENCDFKEFIPIQRNILSAASQYVKKGGALIYSTCTINEEENINQVKWFINQYDFELESIMDYLPKVLKNETTAKDGYIQLFPHLHHSDGFFIARLRKK